MSVTWTLKSAAGTNLTHQPATGSPLALKFDSSGYLHLDGYASETVYCCECTADTSTVNLTLTPDTTGTTLSETLSSPIQEPEHHGGSMTWTAGANGLMTIVLSVPATTAPTYGWNCLAEPPIALKAKLKVKRTP